MVFRAFHRLHEYFFILCLGIYTSCSSEPELHFAIGRLGLFPLPYIKAMDIVCMEYQNGYVTS